MYQWKIVYYSGTDAVSRYWIVVPKIIETVFSWFLTDKRLRKHVSSDQECSWGVKTVQCTASAPSARPVQLSARLVQLSARGFGVGGLRAPKS